MDMSQWFSLLQTIVIVFTLACYIVQSRVMSKQLEELTHGYRLIALQRNADVQHRLDELIIKHPEEFAALFEEPYDKERALADYLVTFLGSIYDMRNEGLLYDHDWNAWQSYIESLFRSARLRNHWKTMDSNGWYNKGFSSMINQIITKYEKT